MGENDREDLLHRLLDKIERLEERLASKEAAPAPAAPSDPWCRELWDEFVPHIRAALPGSWEVALAYGRPLMDMPIEGFGETRPMGDFRWSELCPAVANGYKVSRTTKPRTSKLKDGSLTLKKPVKANTVNREINVIRSCFSWHRVNGRKLSGDPFDGWQHEDERQFKRQTELTEEQFTRFISHGHPLMQDIAVVNAYSYGLRPGEGLWLKKAWLNKDVKEIWIQRPKNRIPRKVPTSAQAWEILVRRAAESRGEYVFVRPNDPTRRLPIPRKTFLNWVVACRRLAAERDGITGVNGERLVAYHWRHFGINLPLQDGEQPLYVAEAAGCSEQTMRDNYVKYPQRLRTQMHEASTKRAGRMLNMTDELRDGQRRDPKSAPPPPAAPDDVPVPEEADE